MGFIQICYIPTGCCISRNCVLQDLNEDDYVDLIHKILKEFAPETDMQRIIPEGADWKAAPKAP